MQGKANSPAEMEALGRAAAERVVPGDVFALTGGLGAGKTHWTKGFAAAMGCAEQVTSPTFPLVHEYAGSAMPVFHFDFYRLDSPDELIALGWDEYLEAGGVIVAEWADKFPDLLPPSAIRLQFTVDPDGGRTVGLINCL
ncbi:MAG TPA: tRNA (adenosine(37)-N6)-threonylcarbamoyltransferase complex ATPase subunit type 1 TsaE [Luteolibacter sp.]|nr:tRNA (adenosine(37)-N6)-threonylcarbamoyltransferase complex ATPase subunit type 1 TsaE [Luteolibacter sp.]